jgi:type 1 fimbriae regulatory protein FimB/type 1 fimbriae regulatory protein FimE
MAKKKSAPRPPRDGPPRKSPNAQVRGREYLTEDEVDRLRKAAARLGRHGHRDATLILAGFRHGLRVSELVSWQWDQVDLDSGTVYIRRRKGSKSGMHTLERDEVTALKKLAPAPRERTGPVFRNERGGPLSESGFFKILARAGVEAGLAFPVHPHMLRHACGFELTRAGHPTRMIQEWLGHRNIQHTVRYTELDPERFRKAKMWNRSGSET